MFGLTALGIFHTLISLVAVVCGFWVLARDREITLKNRLGQIYLVTTFITAATGLGIFQHGGFGPPHALSLLTIIALVVGTIAASSMLFGRASRYVQAVSFSSTILFHMIPAVTESLTRLPYGDPFASSAEDPVFQGIYAVILLVFVIGLTLQVRWLRTQK